jgi:acetate kinase
MVNSQSGLLGVSEISSDMRDLLEQEATDERAADAVAMYCYEVKKRIGAYTAVLGGLDTIVFAGGIGENAATVRQRICEGLGFLGVELSHSRNQNGSELISSDRSGVGVRVIATDEESKIAQLVISSLLTAS